jgi:hypothetical protein
LDDRWLNSGIVCSGKRSDKLDFRLIGVEKQSKTKHIMRNTLIVGLLLLLSASLMNCSKTTDTAKPAENPVTSFLGSTSAVVSGTFIAGPYEIGLIFNSLVAGRLTQVGSKMPEPGTYRITVWDNDTRAVLRQKTVEQTAPDKLTLESIESLPLTANKNYVISINSQSAGTNKKYAYAYKTGGGDFMPFSKGSILILNSVYSGVSTATFPSTSGIVKSEFYGYPEFTFIPD